jgi:hypothetical protein
VNLSNAEGLTAKYEGNNAITIGYRSGSSGIASVVIGGTEPGSLTFQGPNEADPYSIAIGTGNKAKSLGVNPGIAIGQGNTDNVGAAKIFGTNNSIEGGSSNVIIGSNISIGSGVTRSADTIIGTDYDDTVNYDYATDLEYRFSVGGSGGSPGTNLLDVLKRSSSLSNESYLVVDNIALGGPFQINKDVDSDIRESIFLDSPGTNARNVRNSLLVSSDEIEEIRNSIIVGASKTNSGLSLQSSILGGNTFLDTIDSGTSVINSFFWSTDHTDNINWTTENAGPLFRSFFFDGQASSSRTIKEPGYNFLVGDFMFYAATRDQRVAIGGGNPQADNSVAIGSNATTTSEFDVVIGENAISIDTFSFNLIREPPNASFADQVLVRDSSSGEVKYVDGSAFSSSVISQNVKAGQSLVSEFNSSTGATTLSVDEDGIILQSDNGNEWLVDVTNSGNLRTSLVGSGQTDDTRLNQITITANSGQTDPLILAEDSNFSELFTLNTDGDAEFYEPGKGIILVSPDGNERKRVRLGNDGLLKTETV